MHKLRNARWWWAALVCLAAIGAWLLLAASRKPAPPRPLAPVPVLTALAQEGDVPIYLEAIGTVQAFNSVAVRAQVDGALDKITFTEGQDVKAGDVLAQIDARPLRAQLDQALAAHARDAAQLANARVDLRRYTTLVAQDSIATQMLDTQRALVAQLAATVRNDQAQVDFARVQLSHATIVAPIAGRTGVRQIDAGNLVHAADTTGIVTLTQIEPISVLFTLPDEALAAVLRRSRSGPLAVSAALPHDSTPIAPGVLQLVNNQVDAATGTVLLKATLPNRDHALWPGQFVDVRLLLETRRHAVTVARGAVQRGPEGEFVFVVQADGTVRMRPVRLSASNPGSVTALIDAGLAAGERVVTEGQLRLRSGTRVRQVAPAPAS
ncbi:MAG TPA: efflux RND transporter periplasmic adaptor subunit [Telluria sp.]|nr:efflux RND transporter periplasmic adaptor subunit [Telluria sp.]